MNDGMKGAIDRVFSRLAAMPQEEFLLQVREHSTGDVATAVIESRALEAREEEADVLSDAGSIFVQINAAFMPIAELFLTYPTTYSTTHERGAERHLTPDCCSEYKLSADSEAWGWAA